MMRKLKWLITFLLVVPVHAQEVNLVEFARRTYRRELKQIKGVQHTMSQADFITKWIGADGDATKFANWSDGLVRHNGAASIIVPAGNQPITSGLGSTPAYDILTFSGQPLNTEIVTIDGKIYTFQTTLTDVDGNVKIGADAAESRDNLVAAMNLSGVSGTDYAASTTVHTTCYAIADDTIDAMEVIFKTAGTVGNGTSISEGLTDGSWAVGQLIAGTVSSAWAALFQINKGYNQTIMTSGTPAQMRIDKFVQRGNGTFNWTPVGANTVTRFIVDSRNFDDAVVVYGAVQYLAATSGKYNAIEILSGKVLHPNSAAIDRVRLASSSSLFETDAAAVTELEQNDGQSDISTVITSGYIANGVLNKTAGDITFLLQLGGNVNSVAGGTSWVVMGGVCDVSDATEEISIVGVTVYPGAVFLRNEDILNATIRELGD